MGAPGAGMMPPAMGQQQTSAMAASRMPPIPVPEQSPQFWNGKRAQERQIERTGQTRMDRLGPAGFAPQGWTGNVMTAGQTPPGFTPGGKGAPQAAPPSPNMALMAALQRRMGG